MTMLVAAALLGQQGKLSFAAAQKTPNDTRTPAYVFDHQARAITSVGIAERLSTPCVRLSPSLDMREGVGCSIDRGSEVISSKWSVSSRAGRCSISILW